MPNYFDDPYAALEERLNETLKRIEGNDEMLLMTARVCAKPDDYRRERLIRANELVETLL